MMSWKIGAIALGALVVASWTSGCSSDPGTDSPTPGDETPTPTPVPAPFEVYVDCDSDTSGEVLYLGLDTYTSGFAMSGGTVEVYDDYTLPYANNDPAQAWDEFHTLALFDSGSGYEVWERDLVVVGSYLDQVQDTTSIFTCAMVDDKILTYVLSGTRDDGTEYVIAYGKHTDTYCPGCDVQAE